MSPPTGRRCPLATCNLGEGNEAGRRWTTPEDLATSDQVDRYLELHMQAHAVLTPQQGTDAPLAPPLRGVSGQAEPFNRNRTNFEASPEAGVESGAILELKEESVAILKEAKGILATIDRIINSFEPHTQAYIAIAPLQEAIVEDTRMETEGDIAPPRRVPGQAEPRNNPRVEPAQWDRGTITQEEGTPQANKRCYGCGSPTHLIKEPSCKARNHTCESCSKTGHLQSLCRRKHKRRKKTGSLRRRRTSKDTRRTGTRDP